MTSFLYGAAAALIFPTAFFGEATPSTALILSLLTFAAGFIARPIGGIIFGHYGDRVGRKNFSHSINFNGRLVYIDWTFTNLRNDWSNCSNSSYLSLVLLKVLQLEVNGEEPCCWLLKAHHQIKEDIVEPLPVDPCG